MNRDGFKKLCLSLFALAVAATVAILFWSPLFEGKAILSADSPFHYYVNSKSFLPKGFFGIWYPGMLGTGSGPFPLIPNGLLLLFLPESLTQVGCYVFDVILLILATLYFLAGRGVVGAPAYLASLAIGFTGYAFTLISGGHIGNFGVMPFAVLALAFTDRAIGKQSMLHFAGAGLCVGIGLTQAQDVMFMFSLLIAAYGCFVLLISLQKSTAVPYLLKTAAGTAVTLIFFLAVSASILFTTFSQILPGRDQAAGQSPEEKWEFATNWSLPPEEILEFLAPCIFGTQTGDPKSPYWGRLGQTLHWPENHQGLMNLRQHTVYLGALQLIFAVYALVIAVRKGRGTRVEWNKEPGAKSEEQRAKGKGQRAKSREQRAEGMSLSTPDDSDLRPLSSDFFVRRAETFFWVGAWIVCVLLALGRYGPFYRFFYELPYCGSVRCPVKFLHLAEVATVILFAFGLDAFFRRLSSGARLPLPPLAGGGQVVAARGTTDQPRNSESRTSRQGEAPVGARWTWNMPLVFAVTLVIAGSLFLLGAMVVAFGGEGSLEQELSSMGLQKYSSILRFNMAGALAHAGILFMVAAAMFAMGRKFVTRSWLAPVVFAGMLAVVVLDTWSVSGRYVQTLEKEPFYSSNPVIDRLRSDPEPSRVMCPVPDGLCQRWTGFTFTYYDIDFFEYQRGSVALPHDYDSYFKALAGNPLRLWQVAGVRYLLGPTKALGQLLKQASFTTIVPFQPYQSADGSIGTKEVPVDQSSHILLLNQSALPRAAVYYSWEAVDDTTALSRLADPAWNPGKTVLVNGEKQSKMSDEAPQAAKIAKYRWDRIDIEVDAKADAVLLLNDKYDSIWHVFVDGVETELLRCNYIMRGTKLSAGRHSVEFRYRSPYRKMVTIGMLSVLVFLVWGVLQYAWAKRTSRSSSVVQRGRCPQPRINHGLH